ncbi:hypothetical protein DFJ77DRAFT_550495 [Powellomyces hirtus]|nr:hypothetical protein DFJ77DRAFT_550495 [Powellomyces hirtus]
MWSINFFLQKGDRILLSPHARGREPSRDTLLVGATIGKTRLHNRYYGSKIKKAGTTSAGPTETLCIVAVRRRDGECGNDHAEPAVEISVSEAYRLSLGMCDLLSNNPVELFEVATELSQSLGLSAGHTALYQHSALEILYDKAKEAIAAQTSHVDAVFESLKDLYELIPDITIEKSVTEAKVQESKQQWKNEMRKIQALRIRKFTLKDSEATLDALTELHHLNSARSFHFRITDHGSGVAERRPPAHVRLSAIAWKAQLPQEDDRTHAVEMLRALQVVFPDDLYIDPAVAAIESGVGKFSPDYSPVAVGLASGLPHLLSFVEGSIQAGIDQLVACKPYLGGFAVLYRYLAIGRCKATNQLQ